MTLKPATEIRQSVFDFAIREINALEQRIVTAEDDADDMLWDQARQVVEQLEAGKLQSQIAARWINVRTGKPYNQSHVSRVAQLYRNAPAHTTRPRFRKAFDEIAHGDRREQRIQTMLEAAAGNRPLETPERYPIIYADPPWRYEHVKTENRAIENQYPTMALEEICSLPLAEVTTPDCILFLWATSPKLAESFQVIDAWGFTYRTSMVWVKDQIGMGYYARQRHELLLICTKGDPPVPEPANRPDSVVEAPRHAHSEKPEAFAAVITRMYPELPKLEMFARRAREGWAAWGNESA